MRTQILQMPLIKRSPSDTMKKRRVGKKYMRVRGGYVFVQTGASLPVKYKRMRTGKWKEVTIGKPEWRDDLDAVWELGAPYGEWVVVIDSAERKGNK